MNWNKATGASNALFPSLHHRKEGCLHHQENVAKQPKPMQTGWFSFRLTRKTTPSSRSEEASRYLFDRSATPPCGDAKRGITPYSNYWPNYWPYSNSFTRSKAGAYERRTSFLCKSPHR